jgi:hypothetical protein
MGKFVEKYSVDLRYLGRGTCVQWGSFWKSIEFGKVWRGVKFRKVWRGTKFGKVTIRRGVKFGEAFKVLRSDISEVILTESIIQHFLNSRILLTIHQ